MVFDCLDIADYILSKYSDAVKIVEVGVGGDGSVYRVLKEHMKSCLLVATDISDEGGVVVDDVLNPDMKVYAGSDLIYSIRPNPELIPSLLKIGEEVGAGLLIRPLSSDGCHKPSSMRLVNFKRAVLWERGV